MEQAFKDKEGCRISGFVEALRVPGNFYLSHRAFGDIKQHLKKKGYTFDNSFEINHLSFGNKADFDEISRSFPDAGVMHPLDGFKGEKNGETKSMRVGFYLKAVPAIFMGEFGSIIYKLGQIFEKTPILHRNEVFQLTASSEIDFNEVESLVIFNYEVSPFAILYTNARENFFQFLISMCAIIGGVFTFAGIVDSMIHKGSKMVFKDRINKLI